MASTHMSTTSYSTRLFVSLLFILMVFLLVANRGVASIVTLHSFNPGSSGIQPDSGLIQAADGNFYGTTYVGGSAGLGTVFELTPAGTLTTLHSFTGTGSEGSAPNAGIIQASDGNFYGTTYGGGTQVGGTIFRMTPSGALTTLHSFANASPLPSIVIQGSDGNLYGTTYGAVFKMTLSGTFTTLYSFTGGPDGSSPNSLIQSSSDGNFYGTTIEGTIFKVTPSGTLTTLYTFTSPASTPQCLVHGSDGNFYGTALYGGTAKRGIVFRFTPSGTLTVLHSFTNGPDGADPNAGLIQGTDGNLYGTTANGGVSGFGTAFQITTTGILTTVHSFAGPDGWHPSSGLMQASDGGYYGTTPGGQHNAGSVFKITAGSAFVTLCSFGYTDGSYPQAGLVHATDGNFYGVTGAGGAAGYGTVFKMAPDGAVTTLHSFNYQDGAYPIGDLIQAADGNLYGTTFLGGAGGQGSVFKMTTTGVMTTLHWFILQPTDGGLPEAALVQGSDGNLYGTTSYTVFKITPSGTLTTLHVLTSSEGSNLRSALVQGTDGDFYGTASFGGTSDKGTVFKIAPAGTFTLLHSFTGPDGSDPEAGLTLGANGNFYGTTTTGPVFEITPGSALFTLLPKVNVGSRARLTLGMDGNFYGTASGVFGPVFQITPGGVLTTLHTFSGPDGLTPFGGLVQDSSGIFYGTTVQGGANAGTGNNAYGYGTIYAMAVGAFIVVPSAGPGGSLNYSTPQPVTGGGSITFMATPNARYFVKQWLLDGAVVQAGGASYLLSNVTSDHTVAVSFAKIPMTPTNLTATPGNGRVTLSWTASLGAASYSIYRGTTSYGQSATPIAAGITGTTYVSTGLTNGTTYYYRVAAFNASGNSPEGNQAAARPVAPPSIPTSLTATAAAGKVTLSWTASAGAATYNVYRGTSSFGQSATPIATGVPSTTYVDSAVTVGTKYYYRVAAFNSGGNSAEGNQAVATP